MPPKRRREDYSTTESPRKKNKGKRPGRPRKTKQSDIVRVSSTFHHDHGEVDPDEFYSVRRILDENARNYKIDWEDGPNGEKYNPSWEPKGNVTDDVRQEWEDSLAEKARAKQAAASPGSPLLSSEPPRRRRGRPRKNTVPESPRAEELLDEIQDSVGDSDQRLGQVPDLIVEERAQAFQGDLEPERRLAASPEVRITPHIETEDEVDDIAFPSSQVISGTQPQEDTTPEHSPVVDAAAAPNLTQKHSQYEPEDTSRSEEISTGALANSSSSIHTFPAPSHFPVGAVIPDSQSLDSSSYVPTQTRSKQSDETQSQSYILPESTYSKIPESSIPQRSQPQDVNALHKDNTIHEIEDISITDDSSSRLVEDDVAVAGAEVPDSPVSFASPTAAQTSSSTSSPPPTESPDKSQSQLQSQPLQSQISVEQPAQRTEISEFDTTSTVGDNSVSHHTDKAADPVTAGIPSQGSAQGLQTTQGVFASTLLPLVEERGGAPSQFNTQLHLCLVTQQQTVGQVRLATSLTDPSLPISSPIPSVPSVYPGALGESAPPPPLSASLTDQHRTPEPQSDTSIMEPSTPSGGRPRGKFLERMSASRAAIRARPSAAASPKPASAVPARLQSPSLQDRETRSPSMVPPIEAVAKEAPEDYFRSERYETLLPGHEPEPQQSIGAASFEELASAPKAANLHDIRSIPINFGEVQRDHYKQTITWRKDLIEEFTSKVWPANSPQADKARSLLQELRQIVLHPDLINEEAYTQQSQVPPEHKAQWDIDTSTKFRFLKHLFTASQIFNLNILLLARPGRIVKLLEVFLEGTGVTYRVASNIAGSPDKPTATILTTDDDAVGIPTPDLILSLHGNLSDEVIKKVQAQLSQGHPVPAMSLVVPKTVEHIEMTMPEDMPEADRLHILLGTVTAHRAEAGRDRIGNNNAVEQDASSLVNFLLNPVEWPFDNLPDVRLVEPITASQASTASKVENSCESSLNGTGHKRALDDGAETQHGMKRTKISSSGAVQSQDADVSHISDSVASQQAIKALKEEFARKERVMDAALLKAQANLHDHVKALETLQYNHEEQRQELMQASSARDSAVATAQAAALRIATFETRLSDLRIERSDLQDQLREAKASVLNNTVPERAEFEALKEEASIAAVERTKLLNKVKTAEENLDYLREQYQTASNMASSFGKANAALEARVAELEKMASGEQLKLRGMAIDAQSKALSNRNRQLELELQSREELLASKEDEIAKLKESRGRMNTRGSSVPRTPRIGSPLPAAGTSSRQGSPAAGNRPHPLRNVG